MTQIASCNNSEPPVTHCMAKSSFWIKISLSIALGLHCIELSLLSIHLVEWMTMGDFEIWYQPLHFCPSVGSLSLVVMLASMY